MLSLAISEEDDSLKKTMECLDYLAHHKVDVGLTSSASGRSLFLMAIHERGSPIMHIPPRPIVWPALQKEAAKETMTAGCVEACEAAFDGDLRRPSLLWKQPARPGLTPFMPTWTQVFPRPTVPSPFPADGSITVSPTKASMSKANPATSR